MVDSTRTIAPRTSYHPHIDSSSAAGEGGEPEDGHLRPLDNDLRLPHDPDVRGGRPGHEPVGRAGPGIPHPEAGPAPGFEDGKPVGGIAPLAVGAYRIGAAPFLLSQEPLPEGDIADRALQAKPGGLLFPLVGIGQDDKILAPKVG